MGLKLRALSADVPGLRLTDPSGVDERVERTCRILDLSRELSVPVVTASVGALTHPQSGEPSPVAVAALTRIGEYADSRGVAYAVRPSHDGVDRLARLLDEIRCPAIRIGLDPAAMIMSGINPRAWLERDPESVCLVHARDGTQGTADRAGREAILGEGEVDWLGLLEVLREADYQGGFMLRRTDSASPERDLLLGRDALLAMLHSLQR
jgi:sugar phosphate isomerase/epimerase